MAWRLAISMSTSHSPRPPTSDRYGLLAGVPLALGALCVGLMWRGSLPAAVRLPWSPSAGVDLTIWIDGLALEFLLLITGIGTAVFVYAAAYMRGQADTGRLFVLLTAFMAAMVGCVVVDNLLALVVFWELTSVTSFLLVGFKHAYAPARRAAQQALMTTAAGGLALLTGALLIGEWAGSYSLRTLIETEPKGLDHPMVPVALGLVFVGAFTKSAQWPFHFWLPNAMAAPTPVSAYLHSATMVKLGVYLLARLKPAFGHLVMWELTLVTVGALTALWAMVLTLRERDLKRILAWSTVGALGTMVLLLGLPGPGAAEAAAAFLLAHALYKAPLFFVAGNVDHRTGTRRIDHLGAMGTVMPWTAAAAAMAACSMAGVPLSFGYVAKDLIAIAKTEGLVFEWVSYATLAMSALSVAVAAVAAVRVFWHRGGASLPENLHEAAPFMILAPLAVASVGILLGVMPSLGAPLIAGAARSMLAPSEQALVGLARDAVSSAGSTALVFAAGGLVFAAWEPLHRLLSAATWLERLGFAAWYDRVMKAIPRVAAFVTSRLQHGCLPGYLGLQIACLVSVTAVAATWLPTLALPELAWPTLPVALASALIVTASIGVCTVRDPFVMALVSGLAGVGTAVMALFLGAPDVASTQFTVEVAFVIVVTAVIRRVRRFSLPAAVADRRSARALVAGAAGAVTAALVLLPAAGPFDNGAMQYFADRSLTDAHGRNVVNVILVDFRALDTLGELVVIVFTLAAAWPLLKGLRSGRPHSEVQP